MKNRTAVQAKDRLDDLFDKVDEFSGDLELQSHWARYLCVRVSGFIEIAVRAILVEYAGKQSAPPVANYIERQLNRFQNPNMEQLLQLLRSFNSAWADELEDSTKGEPKDAIDSIRANRNRIAHGENATITYATIRQYYQNVLTVIDLIEKQCDSGD